jgi:threonine/homoserine efflux transporter RhtA
VGRLVFVHSYCQSGVGALRPSGAAYRAGHPYVGLHHAPAAPALGVVALARVVADRCALGRAAVCAVRLGGLAHPCRLQRLAQYQLGTVWLPGEGVALVVRLGPIAPSPTVLWAALACTGAALCYGVSTPLMKRAVAHIEPVAIAAGIHLWSVLLIAPAALWTLPQAHFTVPALVAVAIMGIVTSALAYWVHLRIMRQVSVTAAMTPAFMIPLFGVAWGYLFLGEPISSGMLAGVALILVATALVSEFNPFAAPALDAVAAKP